jgi:ribosomal-protein-serine acetyltransferase
VKFAEGDTLPIKCFTSTLSGNKDTFHKTKCFTKMIPRPPVVIPIEENLRLRVSGPSDAQAHLDAVNMSRENLKPWMPWAHVMFSVGQFTDFLWSQQNERCCGNEFGYQIELDGRMVGRISLIRFDRKNAKVEIGYWISIEHQGKGLVTKVTRKMCEIAFDRLEMERIEIRCALGNHRSAAVPQRLGFVLEGVLKHAEKTESGFRDLQLWAQVKADFRRD